MFAGHERKRPLPETLLLTYAAKKRAEVAPGVGAGTDMFSIGPLLGTYGPIAPMVITEVNEIYKRTRARALDSIEQSNMEVNKYVEQLGKATAAATQTSAPAKSEDTPGGQQATGEENPGAGKPN